MTARARSLTSASSLLSKIFEPSDIHNLTDAMSEAKEDAKDEAKDDAKGATAPRGALHVVAEHFEKLKDEAESALSVSTSNHVLVGADSGIELVYSEFVEENADEFEGAAEALADGRGHDHSLKGLHDEFLTLFERDDLYTRANT